MTPPRTAVRPSATTPARIAVSCPSANRKDHAVTAWPYAKPYLYRGDPALAEANAAILANAGPNRPEAHPDFTWASRPFHQPAHGTRPRYTTGCRCTPCREAGERPDARQRRPA